MILDAATLAQLRMTQEEHMMDTCVIYRVAEKTKNSRGEFIKTFDNGAESICGVDLQPIQSESKQTNNREKYVLGTVDAVLRLPHGTTVEPGDEIEIIKRFGEEITPQRFEVDRYTDTGPSGGRAYVKAKAIL